MGAKYRYIQTDRRMKLAGRNNPSGVSVPDSSNFSY